MLRLPATTIQLDHRDLQWHYRRSDIRTRRKERHAVDMFFSNFARNGDHVGKIRRSAPPYLPVNLPGFPAEPGHRHLDSQNWGHLMVGNLLNASPHSLSSQLLEINDLGDASDISDVATTISSDQFSSEDDEAGVPISIDPNVRAATEMEAQQIRAATRSHVDGTSDGQSVHQSSEFPWIAPYLRLVSHERPDRHAQAAFGNSSEGIAYYASLNPGGTNLPGPPMLSRGRHISDTAPLFGSPLRFSEAARANSPERLPTQLGLTSADAMPGGRIGLLRLPERSPLILEMQAATTRDPSTHEFPTSPMRERLERFSPVSAAEMQRIHASLQDSGRLITSQLGRDDHDIAFSPLDSNGAHPDSSAVVADMSFHPSSRQMPAPSPNYNHILTPPTQVLSDSIPLPRLRSLHQSLRYHDDVVSFEEQSQSSDALSTRMSSLEVLDAATQPYDVFQDDSITASQTADLYAQSPYRATEACPIAADQENNTDNGASTDSSGTVERQSQSDILETTPVQRRRTHRR